jgi:hypothetical protein
VETRPKIKSVLHYYFKNLLSHIVEITPLAEQLGNDLNFMYYLYSSVINVLAHFFYQDYILKYHVCQKYLELINIWLDNILIGFNLPILRLQFLEIKKNIMKTSCLEMLTIALTFDFNVRTWP